jgi:kumamolisin
LQNLPVDNLDMSTPPDPDRPIDVTLVLRRRAEPPAAAFSGPPLSRAELAQRYGADPADVEAVTRAVTDAGAEVLSADGATRLVRVRGPLDVLGTLENDALLGTLGLNQLPLASPRYLVARPATVTASYTPLQLAAVYAMPDADGTGQTIAIIELGGGFGEPDLDAYFGGLGLPTPSVTAVSVDGAQNLPGQDPTGADGEVLLDIEVSGAIVPAADLLVYFAPNTDAGFLDAVTRAAHATPAPTAISISWGQSEDQWSAPARASMDAAFADAALLGATVLCAAGDSGSTDREPQAAPHCDFPASSPHVLGCGGTSLQLASVATVATEVVWNDGGAGGATGGGVSDAFPVPDWQAAAGVPPRSGTRATGRGVPDVAAVADPRTGYQVLVDGQSEVIGGTSAVAPLWAGLCCRNAQLLGRPLGLANGALYAGATAGSAAPGFRDITEGSNGAYQAAVGWDPCTGLGVPNGAALLDVLGGTG